MTLEEVKRVGALFANAIGWGHHAWDYWPEEEKAAFQEFLGECGYRLTVVDGPRSAIYVVAFDGRLLTRDDHARAGIALEVLS